MMDYKRKCLRWNHLLDYLRMKSPFYVNLSLLALFLQTWNWILNCLHQTKNFIGKLYYSYFLESYCSSLKIVKFCLFVKVCFTNSFPRPLLKFVYILLKQFYFGNGLRLAEKVFVWSTIFDRTYTHRKQPISAQF